MKEPYYKGYIASYEKYLASSPYVREVMSRLAPHTADARSILDIGAGTGALSLGMPSHIAVTAVESSRGMCEAMAMHARELGRDIRIIEGSWENAETDGAYDIVLCANAVYRMEPLSDCLAKMACAAKGVLLIVMNGREGIGIYGKMRRALKDSGVPCPDALKVHRLCDVEHTLRALAIPYEKELVSWQDVRRFSSRTEATDYLLNRYEVEKAYHAQAERVLASYVTETEEGCAVSDDTVMAFLTITRT